MMIRHNWFQHTHVSHRGEIHDHMQLKKMSMPSAYARVWKPLVQMIVTFPMRASSTFSFLFFLPDQTNDGPGGDNRQLASLAYEGAIFMLTIDWINAVFGFWTSHTNYSSNFHRTGTVKQVQDKMSECFYFYLRVNLKSDPDLLWKLGTAVQVWEACIIATSWLGSNRSGNRADGRAVRCAGQAQAPAQPPTHAAARAQPRLAATLLSPILCRLYTQHIIIQLPQRSHKDKEEKQVKNRSPSVRVFRDEEW